jgi:hypothetical protein
MQFLTKMPTSRTLHRSTHGGIISNLTGFVLFVFVRSEGILQLSVHLPGNALLWHHFHVISHAEKGPKVDENLQAKKTLNLNELCCACAVLLAFVKLNGVTISEVR